MVTLETVKGLESPIDIDHDEIYGVPTLEELGQYYFKDSNVSLCGLFMLPENKFGVACPGLHIIFKIINK